MALDHPIEPEPPSDWIPEDNIPRISGQFDIHGTHMAIVILVDDLIADANVAACAALGCDVRGELTGRKWREFLVVRQQIEAGVREQNIVHGRQATDLKEYEVRRIDGQTTQCVIHSIPIEFRGKPAVLSFIADAASYLPSLRATQGAPTSASTAISDGELERENERLREHIARLLEIDRFLFEERSIQERLFVLTREAVVVTKNKVITSCNPPFLGFVGHERTEDIVGRPISDFVDSTTYQERFDRTSVVGLDHRSNPFEHVISRADGTETVVETVVAQFEKGGDVFGLSISRDITARKEAERKYSESEARFRTLFDLAPAGIMVVDKNIIYANKRLGQILGLDDPSELVGKLPIDFTHEDYHDEVRERMQLDEAVDWSKPVDRVYVRKDGSLKRVELTGAYVTERGKRLFVVAVRDVTEERVAAEKLALNEARLLEAEERYELALEGGMQGVWDWDIENQRSTFSVEWRRMIGLDHEELQFTEIDDWKALVHPDDFEVAWAKQVSHMKGETPGYEAEFRMKHTDGHWVWVLSRGRVTKHGPDGEALRIVGTHTNISDRKLAEQKIEDLNRQLLHRAQLLEAANSELEAFAYSVSHDLRSPLRSIDGFAAAIQEDFSGRLDDDGRMFIERIRLAAKRMSQLIDDMLALSRVTRHPIERKPVNLSEMVGSICEDLMRSNRDRRIEFMIAPNIRATVDAKLIQIALENLLENAVKFTQTREKAVIEFFKSKRDGIDYFVVKDNGVGFDKAYAHSLFRPFARLHTEAAFDGHGIGLATVQRIVTRHGGAVSGDGVPGEGAEFSFSLGS